MRIKIFYFIFASGVLITGCDQSSDDRADVNKPGDRYDRTNIAQHKLELGKSLFLTNCAVCHGNDAEGVADWRKRDKDGKFPPPPLNGTAHAWHHPEKALKYTIKNGTKALGGSMPAWKDKLTEDEIEAIILWFQSKWPEQLYQAWAKRDQESIKRGN